MNKKSTKIIDKTLSCVITRIKNVNIKRWDYSWDYHVSSLTVRLDGEKIQIAMEIGASKRLHLYITNDNDDRFEYCVREKLLPFIRHKDFEADRLTIFFRETVEKIKKLNARKKTKKKKK